MDNVIKDLTLILMYLTSWEEKFPFDQTAKSTWKGYSFDVLNELTDEELIVGSRKSKSITFTERGEKLALTLIDKYGITEME